MQVRSCIFFESLVLIKIKNYKSKLGRRKNTSMIKYTRYVVLLLFQCLTVRFLIPFCLNDAFKVFGTRLTTACVYLKSNGYNMTHIKESSILFFHF